MRRAAVLLSLILALALPGVPARAGLLEPESLSARDRTVLQAALTMTGDYGGRLDGAWGAGSRAALARYRARTGGDAAAGLGALLAGWEAERRDAGWETRHFAAFGRSLALPAALVRPARGATGPAFASASGDLVVRLIFDSPAQTRAMHQSAIDEHTGVYGLSHQDDGRWIVTEAEIDPGLHVHMSSVAGSGGYRTLLVRAAPAQQRRAALIVASLRSGRAPALTPDPDGALAAPRPAPPLPALMERPPPRRKDATPRERMASMVPPPRPDRTAPAAPAPGSPGPEVATPQPSAEDDTVRVTAPEPPSPTGSGTGFFVSATDIVTAAHVIADCDRVEMVTGEALTVTAADPETDLAVLRSARRSSTWLPLDRNGPPRLGQGVAAVGYPLVQLTGGSLTLTMGNVSALHGPDPAGALIVISAPVQPGNSGGPLLSDEGNVLGVVVGQADDMSVFEDTGSIPQNVNFAVRLSRLIAFLEEARVTLPEDGPPAAPLSDGLSPAKQAAVQPILCY